jgi:hypothetical protein
LPPKEQFNSIRSWLSVFSLPLNLHEACGRSLAKSNWNPVVSPSGDRSWVGCV